jgi:hypothetical protein
VRDSSINHTNKQNKVGLRKEGVEPDKIGTEAGTGKNDIIYWLKPTGKGRDATTDSVYVPFTEEDWNSLVAGKATL